MDKIQAYDMFWNSFGIVAYNESSVPEEDESGRPVKDIPHITYEAAEDDFDHPLALTASIWYRSSSWADSVAKEKEIKAAIGRGGKLVPYDGGAFWIKRASPWTRQLGDENDDSVRRTLLNLEVEFID